MEIPTKLVEHLARHLAVAKGNRGPNECWIWPLFKTEEGYGRYGTGEFVSRVAHRAIYQVFVGEVEAGKQVHHTCNNPSCVNPAHLKQVTPKENTLSDDSNTVARQNSLKQFCVNGHEFTPENTITRKSGGRWCRQCRIEEKRRAYAKRKEELGIPDKVKTHCPQGHPYSEENTNIRSKNGYEYRECKICKRERTREYMKTYKKQKE